MGKIPSYVATLLISGGLWIHPLSVRAEVGASATRAQDQTKPSKKRYLRLIDQQLKDLAVRVSRLRARKRSLKGPERDRLSENVNVLREKLHEARNLRDEVANSGDEWLNRKKILDTKVIRLRKSLTYVTNTLDP